MPQYQVLQEIEHNGTIYIPKRTNPPKTLPGAGHPGMRPVEASGKIELTEAEAAPMTQGQLPLYNGVPDPIGAAEFREKKARKDAADADARAADEKAEYEEFLAFKAAKAAKAKK
jgi:hypothetical protein